MGTDITGEISFFSHTIDGSPLWMDVTSKLGEFASNLVWAPARVPIHDLRGKENIVDLDTNGFEVHKYDGTVHNEFDDNRETQQKYYDEIVNVLKKRLGASRVIVFNHRTRYRGRPRPTYQCDTTHRNPLFFPHVDNDPPSAHLKLKELLGEEEAKKAMEKPFQIINVWRPLGSNPIMNIPLTICDYRSLDIDNDVHASEIRGSVVTGSLYMISRKSQDTQKWYYLSEMRSNEMFIFKVFDNKLGVAQFGAHTAFINEYVSSTNIQQFSIEMHCLVLYDQ